MSPVSEYMRPKSSTVAYLLWLLLGCHYLYLRKPLVQLLYWITWGGVGIWALIDLFRIPGLVDSWNLAMFESQPERWNAPRLQPAAPHRDNTFLAFIAFVLLALCGAVYLKKHPEIARRAFSTPVPKTPEQLAAIRQVETVNLRNAATLQAQNARENARRKELNDLYYRSLNVVRKFLKAPSTAKFSNYLTDPETGAGVRNDGTIETYGWVDAQNSFGVPLHQPWRIIMTADHEPVYFRLGDEVIGEIPAPHAYVNGRPTPKQPAKQGDWMRQDGRSSLDRPAHR